MISREGPSFIIPFHFFFNFDYLIKPFEETSAGLRANKIQLLFYSNACI